MSVRVLDPHVIALEENKLGGLNVLEHWVSVPSLRREAMTIEFVKVVSTPRKVVRVICSEAEVSRIVVELVEGVWMGLTGPETPKKRPEEVVKGALKLICVENQ